MQPCKECGVDTEQKNGFMVAGTTKRLVADALLMGQEGLFCGEKCYNKAKRRFPRFKFGQD